MSNIYEQLGVRTIINASGPATRLSGAIMPPAVAAAMQEASQHCVDIAELQARAGQIIAAITGANNFVGGVVSLDVLFIVLFSWLRC